MRFQVCLCGGEVDLQTADLYTKTKVYLLEAGLTQDGITGIIDKLKK